MSATHTATYSCEEQTILTLFYGAFHYFRSQVVGFLITLFVFLIIHADE